MKALELHRGIIPLLIGVLCALSAPRADAAICNNVTYTSAVSGTVIGFELDKDYTCGQYATGDWYVVVDASGFVRLRAITPEASGGRHGFEINPSSAFANALDSRLDSGRYAYDPNLMPSIDAVTGLDVPAGSSILKAVSQEGSLPHLQYAAVLTIVASEPASPSETFRPPYFGTDKGPERTTSDIRWSRLPSYDCSSCSSSIGLDEAVVRMRYTHVDHLYWNQRDLPPADNFVDGSRGSYRAQEYASDFSRDWSEVLFELMLDHTHDAKREAMIYTLQSGIDHAAVALGGGGWPGYGGHGPGRKQIIFFAAVMLEDAEFMDVVANPPIVNDVPIFGVDGQIYRGVDGVPLWGNLVIENGVDKTHERYWDRWNTGSGHGSARDPHGYVDGGDTGTGGGYHWVTTLPYKYTALVAWLLGEKERFDQDELFEYADRWTNFGYHTAPDPYERALDAHHTRANGGSRRSDFGDEMWDAFRGCAETLSCPGMPPPLEDRLGAPGRPRILAGF